MKTTKYLILSILIFYAFLHVVKLEFYPLYTFGMYSETYGPTNEFKIIEIILDGQVLDYNSLNYRKYTYLNNTLKAYDKIIESNSNLAPQADIINKHIEMLPFLTENIFLLKPYKYEDLELNMKAWIKSMFPSAQSIRINKKIYELHGVKPHLMDELVILQ